MRNSGRTRKKTCHLKRLSSSIWPATLDWKVFPIFPHPLHGFLSRKNPSLKQPAKGSISDFNCQVTQKKEDSWPASVLQTGLFGQAGWHGAGPALSSLWISELLLLPCHSEMSPGKIRLTLQMQTVRFTQKLKNSGSLAYDFMMRFFSFTLQRVHHRNTPFQKILPRPTFHHRTIPRQWPPGKAWKTRGPTNNWRKWGWMNLNEWNCWWRKQIVRRWGKKQNAWDIPTLSWKIIYVMIRHVYGMNTWHNTWRNTHIDRKYTICH